MGKKHQREEDVQARLEKELREAKELIRSLERRLKKIDKDYKAEMEELSKEYQNKEKVQKTIKQKCEQCGKGNLFEVDILGRIFINCDSCNYKARKR